MPPSEPAAARARIVHAASMRASLVGLGALTVAEIANAASTSKSNVVERFGGLDALRLATIDYATEIFRLEVIDPAGGVPPGRERLLALCEQWMDYVKRRVFPGGCYLSRVAAESAGMDGTIPAAVREAIKTWMSVLAEQAANAGAHDPDQLAFELTAIGSFAALDGTPPALQRARAAFSRTIRGQLG